MSQAVFTPPQLAKQWGVDPKRIIAWIKSGELEAFDVSSKPGSGRPLYRITSEAIEVFQKRRSATANKNPTTNRRKRKSWLQPGDVEYFK